VDLRTRSRQAQARRRARLRPLRHPVLPARLRLRRGHAVPVDGERLLADGRDRVRHREAPARAGRREHPRRRDLPMYRNLWEHIRKDMPKKGRGQGGELDPLKLPTLLQTALAGALRPLREDLRALAGAAASRSRPASSSSARTPRSRSWSTTTSRASSAARRRLVDSSRTAASPCSATSTRHGNPLPRPNTLLIDSEQLEAGDALDDNFRTMAADEIERFRREIVERTATPATART
jgi:hypothetical protein